MSFDGGMAVSDDNALSFYSDEIDIYWILLKSFLFCPVWVGWLVGF